MCIASLGSPATFASQTNLVVWDAAHGVEHFVRDARFLTKAKDLGFIAPTPSRPTLSEVDPGLFSLLESFAPRPPAAQTAGAMGIDTASKSAVAVIETKDVAGYRATVLRADDPESLTAWLMANGYPSPGFLGEWVTPYVERGWYFTAFKVKGGAESRTGPVRMSFAAKTPFNPYSVPAQNGRGGHVPLRLYYVSAGSETPRIGGKATAWRDPVWSAQLTPKGSGEIARSLHLDPGAMPARGHLRVYQDNHFGTPGLDDLYFVEDGVPKGQTRSGLVVGSGLAFVGLVSAGWLRRKKKA